MARSKSTKGPSSRSSAHTELSEGSYDHVEKSDIKSKRMATVYDAVAGRIGLNGFLSPAQLASTKILPSSAEEVLFRRISVPEEVNHAFYNVDEGLHSEQKLPDSDLVKAVHAYTSDYFTAATSDQGKRDFRSFDGSALLAVGILLEEAAREALGENGDMALVEPEGLELGLPESKLAKHQLVGKVKPRRVQQHAAATTTSESSDELEKEQSPRKRRRAIS